MMAASVEKSDTALSNREEEEELINEGEEEFVGPGTGDAAKAGKAAKSRRRTQAKKKHYTEDSIRLYLQEIGRIRLLRADEEIELARKIADLLELERVGDRLVQQLERQPQESEWAEAVQLPLQKFRYRLHVGRRAKDKMVQSNLRLVVSIAKKYMNRGLSFQDLIQEGSLGLIRAAEKFDHEKGYKFSTYATWWIRQAITRAIANDARTIRLPIHIVEKLNKLKKAQRELKQKLARNPSEEELAEVLDIPANQLRQLQQLRRQALSLNHRVGKEEDTELMDLLEDEDNQSPEARMNETMMRQEIWEVLGDVLTPREKDVISLRYGLASSEPCTLEEVGNMFNLSRERVRQIQSKAMRKLRRPHIAKRLKGWLI